LELRTARRFLFLQYETALGTAVHATPTYEALRRAVPDAHITVLSSGLPCEVLKHNPFIDALLRTPHPLKQRVAAAWYFLTRVRRNRHAFDCMLTDSGNRRSLFHFLTLIAGLPCRIGFGVRYDMNHVSMDYDPSKPILDNNLRLIGLLGHKYQRVEPSVFFTASEADEVEALLRQQGISEQKALVAFQTQTSGGEPNQWFDDRFVQLADTFYQQTDAQILFLGTKSEISKVEGIRKRMKSPSYSAAGRTTIPALAALLCKCDLLITLDTGTMHVGRAVKVPMVVIAPGKNPRHEWLPPQVPHIRVIRRSDVDCTPCQKNMCRTRECMRRIQVTDVLEAAILHLQRFPPSQAERQSREARALLPKKFSTSINGSRQYLTEPVP
jgi:ADP-heptose:LPS heptosyltransferase